MNSGKWDTSTAKSPHIRRWQSWLMPKPFDWVSTPLYLSVFGVFVYYRSVGECDCTSFPWFTTILLGAITLTLLIIDRVEYQRYGEAPPKTVAAVLLIVRIILIELTAQLDNFNFSAFLY